MEDSLNWPLKGKYISSHNTKRQGVFPTRRRFASFRNVIHVIDLILEHNGDSKLGDKFSRSALLGRVKLDHKCARQMPK